MYSLLVRGLVVAATAAVTALVAGCAEDKGRRTPATDGGDGGADATVDATADAADANGGDTFVRDTVRDTPLDNMGRPGFNPIFATMQRGAMKCYVRTDIDADLARVTAICDSFDEIGGDNHMAFMPIDRDDPMATSPPRYSEDNAASPSGSRYYYRVPGIVSRVDGSVIAPHQLTGPPFINVIALIPERGSAFDTQVGPTHGINLTGIESAFQLGSTLFALGTNGRGGPTVVAAYGVRRNDTLEPNGGPAAVYAYGSSPMDIQHLTRTRAVVLTGNCDADRDGEDDDGACLTYIDPYLQGDARYLGIVPLGIDVLPQKELPVTEDLMYSVEASVGGDFRVVRNDPPMEVVGSFDIRDYWDPPFKFIAVSGRRAYLSSERDIVVINFSNPELPFVERVIRNAGTNLGPIAAASGIIYVADDRLDRGGLLTSYIQAIDPAVAE